MKTILENWKRFVEEQGDSSVYGEIQTIIDNNQYLKGKIQANKDTVFDLGDKFFLMSEVDHIAERHQDRCFPGSLFLKPPEDIKKAILSVVKNISPEAGKALAVSTGIGGLGMERLVKGGEEVAKLPDFKMNDGTIVKVRKMGKNPGQVTDKMSVIAPKIGEAGGKPVLSLVTAFPGFMGTGQGGQGDIEIKNRSEFTENGYYFLIPEDC